MRVLTAKTQGTALSLLFHLLIAIYCNRTFTTNTAASQARRGLSGPFGGAKQVIATEAARTKACSYVMRRTAGATPSSGVS